MTKSVKHKKSGPRELSAIFDDIREASCDLCYDLEHSKLPQQLAEVAKNVAEKREALFLLRRQKMPDNDIKAAEGALHRAEIHQTKLNKRLRAFMFKSSEKILKIMTAFGNFSSAATTGNYIAG